MKSSPSEMISVMQTCTVMPLVLAEVTKAEVNFLINLMLRSRHQIKWEMKGVTEQIHLERNI